ncbi:MAG: M43 family zinc metalloprotease [Cyclobacteriaceae bacterium]
MKKLLIIIVCLFCCHVPFAQIITDCQTEKLNELTWSLNPEMSEEQQDLEAFVQSFLANNRRTTPNFDSLSRVTDYTIPVVLHIFHHGDIGKISVEQAQSGLYIINRDFQGLNEDWNSVNPVFEDIKSSLSIKFVLATIDPNGLPTTGIIYHDDSLAAYRETVLEEHAWDNRKYLNIYLPKSLFNYATLMSGFTRLPNILSIRDNRGGIFMSSSRWGYGDQSDFEDGDEWASVATHEAGHWLGLFHTFRNGCEGLDDLVEDTPRTMDNGIQLDGCENNNFSCGVPSNGENYMDYNHGCKKMFTKGQVERMDAILHHEARINLWTQTNLQATGTNFISEDVGILPYPNPAKEWITFDLRHAPVTLHISNSAGSLIAQYPVDKPLYRLNIQDLNRGIYFCSYVHKGKIFQGKFMVE